MCRLSLTAYDAANPTLLSICPPSGNLLAVNPDSNAATRESHHMTSALGGPILHPHEGVRRRDGSVYATQRARFTRPTVCP